MAVMAAKGLRFRVAIMSVLLASVALALPQAPSAQAHPMGNFTINHYSALTVREDRVEVFYVVDMAEIPAYQELGLISPKKSTDLTPAEEDAYISRKAAELLSGLSLSVNGKPLELAQVGKAALSFPPGAGGLPTLRLELSLKAPLGGIREGTLEYLDNNFKERIGWKEIVAWPAPGVTFTNSTVPTTDKSDELRSYPADLINSPPSLTAAAVAFNLEAAPAPATGTLPEQVGAVEGDAFGSLNWVRQQTDAITAVMSQKEVPVSALLVALLLAFSVGAAHALSPGHGKTVVAAYLVGSRGTGWHAVILGLTVTLSHTMGVFLLGFVVLYAADYILPETLYPWLSFLSGALLVVMGLSLFVQRWRAWKRSQVGAPSNHALDGHTHATHSPDDGHAHSHQGPDERHDDPATPHAHGPFGRPHTHLPTDGQQVTVGSLLALGITGGIIPCPSALVVLLVAVASGQVGLGLLLILAFSLGLAAVLTGIGLLMVYGRNLLGRFKLSGNGLTRSVFGRLPMFSALAVSCLGILIAARAFVTP